MDLAKFIVRISLILLVPTLVGVATYLKMQELFVQPAEPGSTKTVLVEVKYGDGLDPHQQFKEFSKELEQKGLIKHWRVIDLLARFRDTQINAGEYELSPGMSPKEILDTLASGKVHLREIVLEAGVSVWEIGQKLQDAELLASKEKFDEALVNAKYLEKAGIMADSFEGYLYPQAYQLSKAFQPYDIILKMKEGLEKVWAEADFDGLAVSNKVNMSRHEILTLASIVQKEAGNVLEMPLVASVYHNRLDNGMKLQSDETVKYGIPDFKGGELTEEDQKAAHKYNTYVNYSLPPAPICNPGEAAIRAVLEKRESPYLFMAKVGEKHLFASTLREHQDNLEQIKAYIRGEGDLPEQPELEGGAPAEEVVIEGEAAVEILE